MFSIITSSLVRDMTMPFIHFTEKLEEEISSFPSDTLLAVFPEYCWRLTPQVDVFNYIETLKSKISSDLCLVLGTLEFTLHDKYTSNAIVLHNNVLYYIPKTKVLAGEVNNGITPGINPGVIVLPHFRLGVLICADLWEPSLVYKLVLEQKADIIAVPAWTATAKGNRSLARLDWHSLSRTVSTQYSVVVAVADHVYNYAKTDVANATVIFSPVNRQKMFPIHDEVFQDNANINLVTIEQSRQRWKNKGLAPL
jgi:predicted amidohydrolase